MLRKKDKNFMSLSLQEKMVVWDERAQVLEKCKVKSGLDMLKLYYKVLGGSVVHMLNTEKPKRYEVDDITLHRIKGKRFKDTYQIVVENTFLLGELKFNYREDEDECSIKKQKIAWVHVTHDKLCEKETERYLKYVIAKLGLMFRHSTLYDVFVDTTKRDAAKRTKRNIRREDYTTILNGKKVKDRKAPRSEIGCYHTGNMDRYTDLTLYITVSMLLQPAKARFFPDTRPPSKISVPVPSTMVSFFI